MNLKDLYREKKAQNLHLIPNNFNAISYLQPYWSHPENYDFNFCNILFPSLSLVTDSVDEINSIIAYTIYSNAYKWEKLYDTLHLEYNPIWNVDGTETTVYGEHETENSNGERNRTETNGARSTTTSAGARNNTSTFYAVPYDSTEEAETGKQVDGSAAVQDTASSTAYEDSIKDAASTDTTTSKTHTDTVTRQGNIGITSSQNLIQQERQVAEFNYMQTVMKDIIDAITIPYWGESSLEVSSGGSSGGGSIDITAILNAIYAAKTEIMGNDNSNTADIVSNDNANRDEIIGEIVGVQADEY